MSKPTVSIILPTYNGSRYLAESVESCRKQTMEDWELVIVDDASTDDTPEVIARLAESEPRIRPVRNETNKKLPGALNVGFAHATGDLLTWTSDDNVYRPEALEHMVAFLGAHPDTDLVYTDYTEIDVEGLVICHKVAEPPEMLAIHDCVGACFLYRRRVYEAVGDYADDIFLAEDYEYWLRAYAEGMTLAPLREDLYVYRHHAASLTDRYGLQVRLAAERAFQRNLDALARRDRAFGARVCVTLAHHYLMPRGERKQAGHFALQALRLSPRFTLRSSEGRVVLLDTLIGRRVSRALVRMYLRLSGKQEL